MNERVFVYYQSNTAKEGYPDGWPHAPMNGATCWAHASACTRPARDWTMVAVKTVMHDEGA